MAEVTNFIEEYLRLTEHSESPDRYLFWGAISCLSAVLRDNVYFDKAYIGQKIFPNMYTLILGDTSNVRKSTPFEINTILLQEVKNTKLITGTATLQGIIKDLAEGSTGKPFGGSGYVVASEASSFLIPDPQIISTLCEMYSYKGVFEKRLASFNEVLQIKNLCFSMFLGTNEVLIQDLMNQKGKEGGLLGRCIVIREDKRRKIESGMRRGVHYTQSSEWAPMITFLRRLTTEKGPVQFEDDALDAYNEWYEHWHFESHYTKTGFEGRLHTHVEKIATILAAAQKGFNKKITKRNFMDALSLCMDLIPEYKRLTFGSGISPMANFTVKVTEELLKARNFTLTRQELLVRTFGNLTGEQVDSITRDLIDGGLAKDVSKNGMPAYTLTEKFMNLLDQKMKARNQNAD